MASRCQSSRCRRIGDLHRAVPLGDGPKRRTRFDGLKLLGVADQHHLGARGLGGGQHTLHLARADHASLVDHQHVAGCQQIAALLPLMLQAGQRARSDAGTALEVLRRDSGKGRAAHRVAFRLHASRATPNIADLPLPA